MFQKAVFAAFVAAQGVFAHGVQADTFSGSVGSEPRTWHVQEVDGRPGATWSETGPLVMAEIFGFPEAGNLSNVTGALEISLTLQGRGDAVSFLDASVTYYAGGVSQLYVPDDAAPSIAVDLQQASRDGDMLHLVGTIDAEVLRVESLFNETLDPDDTLQIAAEFALTLPAR